jgi:hypothetical protein
MVWLLAFFSGMLTLCVKPFVETISHGKVGYFYSQYPKIVGTFFY